MECADGVRGYGGVVRKTTGAKLCMWNGGGRCEQKLIGLMGLFHVVTDWRLSVAVLSDTRGAHTGGQDLAAAIFCGDIGHTLYSTSSMSDT